MVKRFCIRRGMWVRVRIDGDSVAVVRNPVARPCHGRNTGGTMNTLYVLVALHVDESDSETEPTTEADAVSYIAEALDLLDHRDVGYSLRALTVTEAEPYLATLDG